MSSALSARLFMRSSLCHFRHRCLCTSSGTSDSHDPKDTIKPPTKSWQYIVNKFTHLVDKYERKLETNVPKAFKVYQTIKCVRYIVSDTHTYVTTATAIWTGKELHNFTRQELEVYQELPKEMFKILSLLMIASIPVVGNFLVMVGYAFPRQLFTHHLWNDEQKVEFRQYFLAKRITHYHTILDLFDKQVRRFVEDEESKRTILSILNKVEHSGKPTPEELLSLRSSFEPFGLDSVSTRYYRLLGKISKLSFTRRSSLMQEGLIWLHIDRAMVREGIENLSDDDMCKACIKRGLNPYHLSRDEMTQFLHNWTEISQNLDERHISILLHCPALLNYNAPTNIQLMKGKKYRWKRHLGPVEQDSEKEK